MKLLKELEETMMNINEGLPKLPQSLVDFLAEWAWLFAAISAGLGVFAIITLLSVGVLSSLALIGLGAGIYSIFILLFSLVSLLGLIVSVFISYKSIKPLREKLYKGWQLSLLGSVLGFIFEIAGDVINGEFSSIIWSLVSTAIGLYILAQVREQFSAGPELTSQELKGKLT